MIVDSGKEVDDTEINPHLFDYQHDIVKWALKKGKSAVFAGTGLGKTRIQLAWADLVGGRVLIFAPLAVACQTVQEGKEIGRARFLAIAWTTQGKRRATTSRNWRLAAGG